MAKTKLLTVPELLGQFEALSTTEQVQLFTAEKKVLAEKKKLKGEELNLLQSAEIE